ncbi:hypothetical protein NP233_g7755 [Leucocoprinus birnbaumii]|uniref:DUF6534 domain-containing protein n=1 Tax=Leucocoprinus birnbaumii TaxID=56174 RepID=A0AAD5VQ79_9AGAR|nr:hypothetical protein NP233_g7755 [Leucocoprinus birnbaumii]
MPGIVTASETQKMAGPLLFGYLFNLCLLGILLVQVFIYSVAFNKRNSRDKFGLKFLVYIVLFLEVLQSVFILRDAYLTFAKTYGNPGGLAEVRFTWLTMPVLGGTVGCIVQSFYAFRIHILAGRGLQAYVLPIFIILLAIAQCAASIAVGIDEFYQQEITYLSRVGEVGNYIWPSVSAACDVLIAVATSYYLIKVSKQLKDSKGADTSSRPTKTILGRTFHLAIETGSLTGRSNITLEIRRNLRVPPATFSLVYLALWMAYPKEYYYTAFAFVLGKVYANSLMVIFNSRVLISDLRDEPRFIENVNTMTFPTIGTGGSPINQVIEISVDEDSLSRRSFEKVPV